MEGSWYSTQAQWGGNFRTYSRHWPELVYGMVISSISFTTSAKSHSSDDGFEIDATISKQ